MGEGPLFKLAANKSLTLVNGRIVGYPATALQNLSRSRLEGNREGEGRLDAAMFDDVTRIV